MIISEIVFIVVAYAIVCASVWYMIDCDLRARVPFHVELKRAGIENIHRPPPPLAVCYLGHGVEIKDLLEKKETSCFKMDYGLIINTYDSHEFFVTPWEEDGSSEPFEGRLIRMQHGVSLIELAPKASTLLMNMWKSELKKHCHDVATAIGALLLGAIFFMSRNKRVVNAGDSRHIRPVRYEECFGPIMPRSTLKAYAVVTMLTQHFGLLFLDDSSNKLLRLALTLPADIGGSAIVFCFLAGLTLPDESRWSEAVIIGAYMLLQALCPLPSPMSYETLITIAAMRMLWRNPFFTISKDQENGNTTLSSPFARLSILWHAVLCAAVVQMHHICSGSILKIFNPTMTLVAVGGHLLLQGARLPLIALWVLPSVALKALDGWLRVQCEGDLATPCLAIGGVLMLALITQCIVQCLPAKQPLWHSSRLSRWLASNSLEIYVIHLFLMKAALFLTDGDASTK
jgi:hypothetical protein